MERCKNGENTGVDFEQFRTLLEERLSRQALEVGDRPAYDYVLMFKVLILQRYYNLSDEQLEYQLNDRMSFIRFLGLTLADDIPDSRTIWGFSERLTDLGVVPELFTLFERSLEKLGLVAHEGKLVDASFVEVPVSVIAERKTKRSRKGPYPKSGRNSPGSLVRKIPMPAGRRKTTKTTMDIRTTPK